MQYCRMKENKIENNRSKNAVYSTGFEGEGSQPRQENESRQNDTPTRNKWGNRLGRRKVEDNRSGDGKD